MRRIKLTVAYDGTNYSGWQVQKNRPTIEGTLNEALSALCGEEISVIGASRTDAGVHALGNVAVFDTESRIPPDRFLYALNRQLPEEIRVMKSEECGADWHPRHAKGNKTYEYRICNEALPNPMTRLYTHHCPYPLSLGSMRAAAEYLIGTHDFTSFANPASQVLQNGGSAVREIYDITILVEHGRRNAPEHLKRKAQEAAEPEENKAEREAQAKAEGPDWAEEENETPERGYYGTMTIKISGNGFLYNMVRIIAGTLLKVGTGAIAPSEMRRILEAKDRCAAGPTAEAKGLCLTRLDYV